MGKARCREISASRRTIVKPSPEPAGYFRVRMFGFAYVAVAVLLCNAAAGADLSVIGDAGGEFGKVLIPQLNVGLISGNRHWVDELKLGVQGPPAASGNGRRTLLAWTPFVSSPRVLQDMRPGIGNRPETMVAPYRLEQPRVLEAVTPRVAEPYMWLGWNTPVDRDDDWAFSIDIGVLVRRTSLDVLTDERPIVDDPMLIPQLGPDDDGAEDAARGWRFRPVMSIGANVRF